MQPRRTTKALSMEDKIHTLQVWPRLKQHLQIHGVDIFLDFLANYPHNKQYFNIPLTATSLQMRRMPHLRKHADIIIKTLCSFVEGLETPGPLKAAMKTVAIKHHKLRIKKHSFEELRTTVLMKTDELVQLTNAQFRAWDNILYVLFKLCTDCIEELETLEKRSLNRSPKHVFIVPKTNINNAHK